jgi:rod shape determining protein RodA
MQLQPSELMKIAMILALARYFSMASDEDVRDPFFLIKPLVGFVLVPVLLVLVQPDLGTAIKLFMISIAMFFLIGVPLWVFIVGGGVGLAALPILWHFMHDYQKRRVEIFLNPESDPLGGGYHISQSKIAIGAGGFDGKGFLQGTQSQLDFLPEKQTDFIFTLMAEEWGFVGSLVLLALLMLVVAYGIMIALRSQNQFGRMLAMGVIINYSLYLFINIGMVMGLMPVVGVPIPLISHGGTAMLSAMFGFGLIMSVWIHKDIKFNRRL